MTTHATSFRLTDLDARIRDEIYEHVFSSLELEVGGVLIGNVDEHGKPVVEAAIAALEAENARASVTFTHEAWQTIISAQENDYPDSRIIGWYHSHPGFGIFLSEHDLFIHRHFFPDPAQIAYVIDPREHAEGVFGWINGEIVMLDEGKTTRRDPNRRTLNPTVVVELDDADAAEAPAAVPVPAPTHRQPTTDTPPSQGKRNRRVGGAIAALAVIAGGGLALALSGSGGGSSSVDYTTKTVTLANGQHVTVKVKKPSHTVTQASVTRPVYVAPHRYVPVVTPSHVVAVPTHVVLPVTHPSQPVYHPLPSDTSTSHGNSSETHYGN